MRTSMRLAGILAMCLTGALALAGCSALLGGPGRGSDADRAPEPAQGQTVEAACEIVVSEWGWALDPWYDLRDGGRNDFAQEKVEHQEIISELQGIADRVEQPEVREALDATIAVHQQYADEIWQGLMDIPEGYVLDMNDPENKIVILGTKRSDYTAAMSEADVQRFDLCGGVQDGQTPAEACAIVNEDWTDGAAAFNSAANDAGLGRVDEGIDGGASALKELKSAMAQVTVPEALDELTSMYDAYETYYDDAISTAKTEDELMQLSVDELNELIAEGDSMFAEWDALLQEGESKLVTYCGGVE